jgi:hypothetical protein
VRLREKSEWKSTHAGAFKGTGKHRPTFSMHALQLTSSWLRIEPSLRGGSTASGEAGGRSSSGLSSADGHGLFVQLHHAQSSDRGSGMLKPVYSISNDKRV